MFGAAKRGQMQIPDLLRLLAQRQPSNLPPGMDPMPSQLPPGYDPNAVPGQVQPKFIDNRPGMLPPGFDPNQAPQQRPMPQQRPQLSPEMVEYLRRLLGQGQ